LSKKEALEILNGLVRPADREWRTLESGYDSVNLDNFILGNFNPNIESYFDLEREGTKRDRDYILNQSLSSKINSPLPPQPETFIENQLSSTQLSLAKNTLTNNKRGTQSLIDEIKFENTRSVEKRTDC
jgi:hypothetical protein